ncbi:sensor histidine kinase [Paenibacillus caui]|uniref:sensor histidine kinase n=1 Tax=Paenibacillus caui TaxID=2873927 RepID=UPI001CA8C450|nr:HAMP domain-containing sensor histidine kinase [Paenibacillus caui]
MKTKLRFSIHFVIGLFGWLVSMGLTAMLSIDYLFPLIGIVEGNTYYDLYVLLVFLFNIMGCSVLFSWYFGGPLWFMMSWISNLSKGVYEPPYTKSRVYTRKNKLRKPYQLYEEVIENIHSLSNSLKQAEKDRNKLEEAKRDWIAGISHDLKTPLTFVTGYSALLLNEDYIWSEEEKSTFLNEIHTKGLYIEDLIQDLNLSFQMNNSQSPFPLHLSKLNLFEFMQRLIADVANDPRAFQYDLSFHSEEGDMELHADEKLLYRALQNLLMNAIEHNPAGTSIHVTLNREQDQLAQIAISDNGVGMDQDMLDNLFSKYYRRSTAKTSKYGTGLGMAIVKSLILAHGGHLTVDSELSKGTTFTITLPLKG